jgi:hypothetical protein
MKRQIQKELWEEFRATLRFKVSSATRADRRGDHFFILPASPDELILVQCADCWGLRGRKREDEDDKRKQRRAGDREKAKFMKQKEPPKTITLRLEANKFDNESLRSRKDRRGVDLTSDVLPLGSL